MKAQDQLEEKPVIIIAAARSGTKLLREALSRSLELASYPYDVNYIWKYGNYDIDHDELAIDDLTPEIKTFIREQFGGLLKKSGTKRILEKSVSNCLRVDFVRSVFPGSKIIHLYRDGRDVAADAMLCWQAGATDKRIQSKGDLIKKIIHFPFIKARRYLLNYISMYAEKLFLRKGHVPSWGPRFKGIDETVKNYTLIEVCGIQWSKCVEAAVHSLTALQEGIDYINLRYEDFVSRPVEELRKVAAFVEIDDFEPIKKYAEGKVTNSYVGFWEKVLSYEESERMLRHIRKQLNLLGYEETY